MNNKLIWVVGFLAAMVAVNLGLTAYVAFRAPPAAPTSASEVVEESVISEAKAEALGKGVVALFNNRDSAGLYQKFDPLARVQITEQHLTEQTEKLQELLGSVSDMAYSHAELAGTNEGKTYYYLHYKVSLKDGSFKHGTMKLTVVENKGNLGLFGFFLNGADTPSG